MHLDKSHFLIPDTPSKLLTSFTRSKYDTKVVSRSGDVVTPGITKRYLEVVFLNR